MKVGICEMMTVAFTVFKILGYLPWPWLLVLSPILVKWFVESLILLIIVLLAYFKFK